MMLYGKNCYIQHAYDSVLRTSTTAYSLHGTLTVR